MANCNICARPVLVGAVMHSECIEQLVTEVAEQFCDNFCRWPLTNVDLLGEHCKNCPMDRLTGLWRADN